MLEQRAEHSNNYQGLLCIGYEEFEELNDDYQQIVIWNALSICTIAIFPYMVLSCRWEKSVHNILVYVFMYVFILIFLHKSCAPFLPHLYFNFE